MVQRVVRNALEGQSDRNALFGLSSLLSASPVLSSGQIRLWARRYVKVVIIKPTAG